MTVDAQDHHASIGAGLCVLLAVVRNDDEAVADWIANKLAHLRIFADDAGKMNRSVLDVGGKVLLVSQFTLAGDCARGHRPSFEDAAPPDVGRHFYERVAERLTREHGVPVETGLFGALMRVTLVNDGPVTVIVQKTAHG